ncbi:MAG: type II secretion system protein GspK [Synergistaceae bacterium]|nr:type II secretion system protein GspK [Synergistaceae bacterium]
MRKFSRTSKEGFILITVLMISALFLSTAVAYAMFARQEMRRVANEEFAGASRTVAVIASQEAREWIARKTDSDSRRDAIYSGSPIKLNYDDYSVYITLTPLDDKIPINGLLLPDGITIKNEYLYAWNLAWSSLGFSTPPPVLDFISPGSEPGPGGREEDYFPNKPLSDLSELMRLPEIGRGNLYAGVSADLAIDSYFTVYGKEGININMASPAVIRILDPGLGPDVADAIASYRLENAIKNERDLANIAGFSSSVATRLKNVINYTSNFFLLELLVERGTSVRSFEAIILKDGEITELVNWKE